MSHSDVPKQRSNPQQRSSARAIVRYSRAVNAASLLPDIQRSVGGKNSVDMRAQSDVAPAKSRMCAKDISDIIDPDIV
jgi:hypothetical protein